MAFSGLMGFIGGAARAGEQVADQTLARMDAAGVAKAKEEAQLRLEQRTEQAAIAREGRANSREDFTYKRGLMDAKAKTAEERQFAIDDEQRKYDLGRTRIPNTIKDSNAVYTGSKEKQEGSEKNKSEINLNNAKAARDQAEAKKALAEIGNGGKKPLTESELAAQVEVGDKGLRIAYRIGVDPVTGLYTGNAEDVKGYLTAKQKLERAVRNGESLPAAYVEKLFSGTETEKSTAKAQEDSDVKAGVEYINKNSSWYKSSITPEKFKQLPQEEQDKAISQGKASAASKQKSTEQKVPPAKDSLKNNEVIVKDGKSYTWNSQTQKFYPVSENPKGLMSGADDLAGRAEAARKRMDDLAKKTGYTSPEERDAARKQKHIPQKPENAPGGTKIENPVINTLPKMGLSEQGKRDEAEYQKLGDRKISDKEYMSVLQRLLGNEEFRNNHPEVVRQFKNAQDELAAFNEKQKKKGSR